MQRSEDGNDDDVKAFALDGSASKDVQVKRNKEVMVAEEEEVSDDTPAKSSAVTRPSAKLTLVSLVPHLVRLSVAQQAPVVCSVSGYTRRW